MVTLFIFGILVTCYSLYGLYKWYKLLSDSYTRIISDYIWTVIITITLLTVGPTMLYFGYTEPSSQISHTIDNHNGTLTAIEYSMSGDSVIKNNIKAPKDTYGVVTDVHHYQVLMGKVFVSHTKITSKLNDGRVVYTDYSKNVKNISVGQGMKLHEIFYPNYEQEFNF